MYLRQLPMQTTLQILLKIAIFSVTSQKLEAIFRERAHVRHLHEKKQPIFLQRPVWRTARGKPESDDGERSKALGIKR